MADLSTFERYYKLADMLIEKVTKEQLAECARLLALNLAHHQARHGEIPLDETLALLDISEPNEAQEGSATARPWLSLPTITPRSSLN